MKVSDQYLKNRQLMELYLADRNKFFKLLKANLDELLPIIYTPTVGVAAMNYSQASIKSPGLIISYQDRANIEQLIVDYINTYHKNIRHKIKPIIVVTDGEGVLGIGDQGIGALEIVVAKSMLYTIYADIDNELCVPIMLDVGTNNLKLLEDPQYCGWRHKRISDEDYYSFLDEFINALNDVVGNYVLHWEDLGKVNAPKVLARYRNFVCSFNDDIQGTAAVTLMQLLEFLNEINENIKNQQIVVFGSGTAGAGIADFIAKYMVRCGLSADEAYARLWLIDRQGLLCKDDKMLSTEQQVFAKDLTKYPNFANCSRSVDLLSVVQKLKPSVLLGCSGCANAFSEQIIKTMTANVDRPIVLPLSNPNILAEAVPADIIKWSKGAALVATGSPFAPVEYNGKIYKIPQCNNARVFPRLGKMAQEQDLKIITDEVLFAAAGIK